MDDVFVNANFEYCIRRKVGTVGSIA
jgi:hypothetical protein